MSKPSDAPKTGLDLTWRVAIRNPGATGASADWGDVSLSDLRSVLGISIPALQTLTFSAQQFTTTAASGSLIGTISGKTAGSTLSISPNDGRIAFNSDQSAILVGLTASSAGTITYTVTETLAGATGSPKTTSLPITVSSARANPQFVTVNVQGMDNGNRNDNHASDVEGQQYSTASLSDAQYLAARGITVVRMPVMPERLFLGIGAALNNAYCTVIERVMTDFNSVGIKVILDVHGYCEFYNPGRLSLGATGSIFTIAEWVRQWTAIAQRFKGHPGLFGYDYNEPQGLESASILPTAMAAFYDAITNPSKGNDTAHWIFIEGDGYSNASQFWTINTGYPLSDPYDRIIYSGHMYMDPESGGNTRYYPTWAQCLTGLRDPANNDGDATQRTASTAQTGVQRLTPFAQGCASRNVRGFVGEIGLYGENQTALQAGYNAMSYAVGAGLSIAVWHFGPTFGADAFATYPYNGVEQPQWGVIRAVGVPSTTYTLTGPDTGPVGSASSAFTAKYTGRFASAVTLTPVPQANCTFSPASVTFAAGTFNPTATFTVTKSNAGLANISATNNGGLTDYGPAIVYNTGTALGGAGNGVLTQTFTNPSWLKTGAVNISSYVDPADGLTYTRLQMTGDYHSNLSYTLASHGAENVAMEFKTLGSADQLLNFYSGSGDNNFDFSTGNNPKNTWVAISKPLNANAPFALLNRGVPTDVLIRKAYAGTGTYT